ncbi:conserved hypothetical protein [hydrothermal vent metagenome]|uniref:GyrI-like small molecule binding domain-containing protein n=1 Tax=hydrothermal vent metagenome TaxID=652676 RepID=A0A3B0WNW5_9ZZZZ
MEKIDYKKEFRHLYKASAKKAEIVTVPKMSFLMLDGKGDPNTSQAFQDAIEVLYPVSYALKFMIKKGETGLDYGVLPLEGLWWSDDMSSFSVEKKSEWKWTLMIMQPEIVTTEMVQEAIEQVKTKKNPTSLPLVRFESFEEGESAQIMHIGPFSEEGPTIEKLHASIESNGRKRKGKHHEIYLSDIRRAVPEKWKTIIRQPVS